MEKIKVKNKIFLGGVLLWMKSHKTEFILLIVVLMTASFLRLFKISQYMTFLGDEGRDAIIVRNLWVKFDPILIGPGTSIGNMYLGPLYYYLIAPSLLIANFSPVGPSVFIALTGVATVFLVWLVIRKWFYRKKEGVAYGALAGAFLYAVAPTVIIYSRSSWNPNIMPFVSLLSIYSIWQVFANRRYNWLLVLAVSYAFVVQSHYLGLLLLPTILIFWAAAFFQTKKENSLRKIFLKKSLISGIILSLLMSPLFIFDARHGWNNFAAMKKFFLERQTTVSAKPWNSIPNLFPLLQKFIVRTTSSFNITLGNLLIAFIALSLLGLAYYFWKNKKKFNKNYLILLTWLAFGMVGLGLYKQEIYDHYFGFMFTVPFILGGAVFTSVASVLAGKNKLATKIFYAVSGGIFLSLVYFAWAASPLKSTPNGQLQRSQIVADKIIAESQGQKFNLAVVAERNYEDGYQYFLEKDNAPVVEIDAQKAEETITNQLFVVCEMSKEKCNVVNNAKAQVANFGWSQIEGQWDIAGVTLYKLVHVEE